VLVEVAGGGAVNRACLACQYRAASCRNSGCCFVPAVVEHVLHGVKPSASNEINTPCLRNVVVMADRWRADVDVYILSRARCCSCTVVCQKLQWPVLPWHGCSIKGVNRCRDV
jgi:hypothetical protein